MMIDHIIHFYPDYKTGLSWTWHLQLPYRLVLGDYIHEELLWNRGELQYQKELDKKYYELDISEYLIVDHLKIDHNADVVACITIPNEPIA